MNVMCSGYRLWADDGLRRLLTLNKFEDGNDRYQVYDPTQAVLPLASNLMLLGPRCLFCKGEISPIYWVILGLSERVMYNVYLSLPGSLSTGWQS